MLSGDFEPLRKDHRRQQSYNASSITASSQIRHASKSISADTLRSRHGIEVEESTGQVPDPIKTFDEMTNLPHHLKTFLKQTKRLVKPTPVQMQAIGCLEASRDVICLSATGTGKTLAYLLPMCSFLWKHRKEILQQSHLQQQQPHQQQYQNQQYQLQQYQQQYQQQQHHKQQYPQQNKSKQDEICRPSCLIIVPTRELMYQVLENTQELVNALGLLTFEQVEHNTVRGGHWPVVGRSTNHGNNQSGQYHLYQQQLQQQYGSHQHHQQQQQQPSLSTNNQYQFTGISCYSTP